MPGRDQVDLYVGSVVIDVNDLDLMSGFWKEVLAYDVELKREHWAKLVDPNERRATVSLRKEGEDFVVLADPEGNLFCVIDKTST